MMSIRDVQGRRRTLKLSGAYRTLQVRDIPAAPVTFVILPELIGFMS